MSQYHYTIEYRKTVDHSNADALSCLPSSDDAKFDVEEQEGNVSTFCTIQVISRQLNPSNPGLLAKESSEDPVICTVMHYVKEVWPI